MTYTCLICNEIFQEGKKFSNHLQSNHKINSEEYTVKHILNGQKPKCQICNSETRYVGFGFKQFCKVHAKEAMKKGGSLGGKKKVTWSKGKTKFSDSRLLKLSNDLSGFGNHFLGKTHSQTTINILKQKSIISEDEFKKRLFSRPEFDVLTDYKSYTSRQKSYLECKCVTCGTLQKKTLQAFERGSLCRKCFPFSVSKEEIEIGEFVETLGFKIEKGNRQILSPLELDIFIPEASLAIEYNGLYWHGIKEEKDIENKTNHLIKTQESLKKGIKLIHIFSDEWIFKQELIKSMLKQKLGKTEIRLNARDCFVTEITNKERMEFFNKNHIDGDTKAVKCWGLQHPKQGLVTCLSVRKPITSNHKEKLEIARFATAQNISVRGGFSKLLKTVTAFAKENSFKEIISYSDNRFGLGQVYTSSGMTLVSDNTGLNYWYTDGQKRYNRFKFRATLEKSEKEVAKEAGVYPIFGCGNSLFNLKL